MAPTAEVVKEPKRFIVDELVEALEGVLEMLDTPNPAYVNDLLERYYKIYGKNADRGNR